MAKAARKSRRHVSETPSRGSGGSSSRPAATVAPPLGTADGDEASSEAKAKIGGGGGMYRSEFLVRKIAQQNEKKKTDRLANKGRPAAGSNKDGAGAKGKKAVVPPTESEEALVQIIEDLRSDLQIRD